LSALKVKMLKKGLEAKGRGNRLSKAHLRRYLGEKAERRKKNCFFQLSISRSSPIKRVKKVVARFRKGLYCNNWRGKSSGGGGSKGLIERQYLGGGGKTTWAKRAIAGKRRGVEWYHCPGTRKTAGDSLIASKKNDRMTRCNAQRSFSGESLMYEMALRIRGTVGKRKTGVD